MDRVGHAPSSVRLDPPEDADGKGRRRAVTDGKGQAAGHDDALAATPYGHATPTASAAGAALALHTLASPFAGASATLVAPADERRSAALTCVSRTLQIARRVGFLSLEHLSADLARLYAICPPAQAARDVGKLIAYLTDERGIARSCSSEWCQGVASAALAAITAAMGDAHKADFLSGLIVEGNVKVTNAFERLLCEACAGLIPQAWQVRRSGQARHAALEHALLKRLIDTPYLGEGELRRRGRLMSAYFAGYSTAEKLQQGLQILTEPLTPSMSSYPAYRLRATAWRALALVPTEFFMARLNGRDIGLAEPARSAALLVRSLAYERGGPVSHTPDPRQEFRPFCDIDGEGDGHLDAPGAQQLQQTVRHLLATLVAPFETPLPTLDLQRCEARIIAMCNHLDGRDRGGVEVMMTLARDTARLALPPAGHACREQTLSVRARAIANLVMRRLELPVAGFLEEALPEDQAARRDTLALRAAVWWIVGGELSLADKFELWKSRLGQRSDFRHVTAADRSILRGVMFTGLWREGGVRWAEDLIDVLRRIGQQHGAGPEMVAHCARELDGTTLEFASPDAALRLADTMCALCCPGDHSSADASAIISLARSVRHAWTEASFNRLRDAMFGLIDLQVRVGAVERKGQGASPGTLDTLVDDTPDSGRKPACRGDDISAPVAARAATGALAAAVADGPPDADGLDADDTMRRRDFRRADALVGLYAALFVGSAAPAAEALSRRSFFDAQIGLIKAQPELTVVEKQMVVNSLIALRAQYGVEPRPVG